MNFWQAIILGIVEGVTEFLPVSSTGHLILAGKLLGLQSTEFFTTFEIAIQVGAILAVVVLYGKSLLVNIEVWKRILAAFFPTMVVGFAFYHIIKIYFLGNAQVVIWALFLGGVFLVVFERMHKEKSEALEEIARLPYSKAFIIGLFQSLAMIPGVSRAAATIIGGLMLGLKRKIIVEFSFILAVPTMLAATGWDLLKSGVHFSSQEFTLLMVGCVVSFGVAVVSIKLLLSFIKTHSFIPFGIYRIGIATLFGLWLI